MKLLVSLVFALLIRSNIEAQTTVSFLSSTGDINYTDNDTTISTDDNNIVLKKMVSYCTSSKIRLVGQTIDFSWTVEGFLNYFYSLNGQHESRFQAVNITDVKFETLTGNWLFALGKFGNDTQMSVKAVYETRSKEEHDMTFDGEISIRINDTTSLYLCHPLVSRKKKIVEPVPYKFEEDDHQPVHPGGWGRGKDNEKDHQKKNDQKHPPSSHPDVARGYLPNKMMPTGEAEMIELKWIIGADDFNMKLMTPLEQHLPNDQFDLVFRLKTVKRLAGGKSEISRDCEVEKYRDISHNASRKSAAFGVNKHRYSYSTTDASAIDSM